jgi:hypothetical protein
MRAFRRQKATLHYIPKKKLGNDRIDYYHSNSTYGDNDSYIAFRGDDREFRVGSTTGMPLVTDINWFSRNLHRRIFLRPSTDFEKRYLENHEGFSSDFVDSWVAVLISPHNIMWNTVVFRFAYGSIQTWNTPQTDDEVLAIIGRFDPQAMIAVKLLSISSRYMKSTSFSLFDHRAHHGD